MSDTPRTDICMDAIRACVPDKERMLATATIALSMMEYDLYSAYKRLAKLEPDAERYRWLRDHHRSPMSEIRIAMSIGHDWIDPESHELDAAIDAARAKDKPLWNGYDDGLPHHNR